MYTSVSDAEYRMRRAKAEREARSAYARASASPPHKQEDPPLESAADSALSSSLFGGVRSLLSRVKEDDLLILGLLFLLFNESDRDDPLILIILAALLFTD